MAITKKDGTIIIDTLINTKGFNKGAGNMQKSISGLSGTISKLGVAIGVAPQPWLVGSERWLYAWCSCTIVSFE